MSITPADSTPNPGPLRSVRVLDLTSVLMGPLATQIFGDLGADVISIEEAKGDANRVMGRGPHPQFSGVSLNLLRNKRNVCLDLKAPGGVEAALRIAATCDVVVTNLRPGPLARLGLTYADVQKVQPSIIFCQAHGWPSDSPGANRPAYDDIVQVATGIADSHFRQTGEVRIAPMVVADKVSGLTITYAVLAALFHRERTGEGQFIEVAMTEAMTSWVLSEHGAEAIPEPKIGPAGYTRILAPNRRPYATADGHIATLPYSLEHYRKLFAGGGAPEVLDDPRIATAKARILNSNWLYGEVAKIIRTQTTAFWLEFCERNDIPSSPVTTLDELVDTLPLAEHQVVGTYRQLPAGARFSKTPASVRRDAPLIGQHNHEVLTEVGYSDDEITALVASGTLRESTME
jgi:crotonobetainyl-CoA:carnitine CoA-transferase CaiB-like acyl-CoA transferase